MFVCTIACVYNVCVDMARKKVRSAGPAREEREEAAAGTGALMASIHETRGNIIVLVGGGTEASGGEAVPIEPQLSSDPRWAPGTSHRTRGRLLRPSVGPTPVRPDGTHPSSTWTERHLRR